MSTSVCFSVFKIKTFNYLYSSFDISMTSVVSEFTMMTSALKLYEVQLYIIVLVALLLLLT